MAAYDPEIFKLPFPSDYKDEPDETVLARANAMIGAAEKIMQLSIASEQAIAPTPEAAQEARELFDLAKPSDFPPNLSTEVAVHFAAMLSSYDFAVVQNSQQIRNLCTNVLIEKAVKGKTEQVQLRAVEMLGKIKDVSLFDERTTVTVEHMVTDDIKKQLKEKIATLRSLATPKDITDIPPSAITEVPE